MIEKSSINSDLFLYLLSYSRCSHIKHSYKWFDAVNLDIEENRSIDDFESEKWRDSVA
jgi:hypothetical protein